MEYIILFGVMKGFKFNLKFMSTKNHEKTEINIPKSLGLLF